MTYSTVCYDSASEIMVWEGYDLRFGSTTTTTVKTVEREDNARKYNLTSKRSKQNAARAVVITLISLGKIKGAHEIGIINADFWFIFRNFFSL